LRWETVRAQMDELQRTLGTNLRGFRETEDLSQEVLAQVLGVHRTYMAALERGERNVSLKSGRKDRR
jgi:DNA-binding XRE family transcriptional regulator